MDTLSGDAQRLDEEGAICDECGTRIGPSGCCATRRRDRQWDVRNFFAALKESGLDGLSHEDGWTLMETTTANALRERAAPTPATVERAQGEQGVPGSGEPPKPWPAITDLRAENADLRARLAAVEAELAESNTALRESKAETQREWESKRAWLEFHGPVCERERIDALEAERDAMARLISRPASG